MSRLPFFQVTWRTSPSYRRFAGGCLKSLTALLFDLPTPRNFKYGDQLHYDPRPYYEPPASYGAAQLLLHVSERFAGRVLSPTSTVLQLQWRLCDPHVLTYISRANISLRVISVAIPSPADTSSIAPSDLHWSVQHLPGLMSLLLSLPLELRRMIWQDVLTPERSDIISSS